MLTPGRLLIRHMDNFTVLLLTVTCALVFVTIQAWLVGNDKRDVALLGAIATAVGLGTAVAVGG